MSLTKTSYSMITGSPVNVLDFGAIGDGVSDDTAAINSAIDFSAINNRTLLFPNGTYLITSTIDLTDKRIVLQGYGFQTYASKIVGNFDGYLFNLSGTPSVFNDPTSFFSNLFLENSHNGTSVGSAGCIKAQYAGRLRVHNCQIKAQNTCIRCTETISMEIANCEFVGDSATNGTNNRGIYGQGRHCKVWASRFAGFFLTADISGDDWGFHGCDFEFNTIIFRTAGALLASNCHIETSGMIWTNAFNLPTTTTSPWTDNGGTGSGWDGSVHFADCHVSIGSLTDDNGIRAPAFVCKTSSGFFGRLKLSDTLMGIGSNMATLSNNFSYNVATSQESGLGVIADSTVGFIPSTTIPANTYTNYIDLNSTLTNVKLASNLSGDIFLGDGSGSLKQLSGGPVVLEGFNEVRLQDFASANSVIFINGNEFIPSLDNGISLGISSNRWSVVYAATGTINTSDAGQKQDISTLDEAEKLTAKALKQLIRKFKFKSSVIKKGTNARYHFGIIAQEVESAFSNNGLNANDYGIFCSDTWYVLNDKVVPAETVGAIKTTQLGIRYDELLCFIISVI